MSMKDGFNFKTLFPSYGRKYLQQYTDVGDRIILFIFTVLFCIVGLVGNGNIIWLLGFRIQRKPFAIYILNLAVADFGLLVFLLPLDICFDNYLKCPIVLGELLMSLSIWMYSICQLLLTAISIDRWVSVLFPNWYQCHQSPLLSTTVCAFIWALSSALMGVPLFLFFTDLLSKDYRPVLLLGLIVTIWICLLLTIISTLTLFTKVCLKSPKGQCGSLLNVTLLMLLFFLLFTILSHASFIMFPTQNSQAYFDLWTSLKSSINPLIYFLAGRQNTGEFQERMKVVLQRVFREVRDIRMESQPRTQTRL